ncbi:hypothetical protein [Accumulibacter sp.]|nr:hypothetical protein [Accumulibacter sp.]
MMLETSTIQTLFAKACANATASKATPKKAGTSTTVASKSYGPMG